MRDRLAVTGLDVPASSPQLDAVASLLDEYRQHSSLASTWDWLADQIEHRGGGVLVAARDDAPIGFATSYASPMTLGLGLYRALGFTPVDGVLSLTLPLP